MTREEAIDVFKHNYPSTCFTDLCEAVDMAIQALSIQPIDAVEVVRCLDCALSVHGLICERHHILTNPRGYCSDGERRADE